MMSGRQDSCSKLTELVNFKSLVLNSLLVAANPDVTVNHNFFRVMYGNLLLFNLEKMQ